MFSAPKFSFLAPFLTMVFLAASGTSYAESKHSISPIYNWAHLVSQSEQKYDIHSVGLNYTYYRGADFGFLGLVNLIIPLGATQDNESYYTRNYYSKTLGADVQLCIAGNLKINDRMGIIPAVGVHLNGIMLTGTKYQDFHSLTTGLGYTVLFYYNLTKSIFMGGLLSGAVDFMDLIHEENDLKIGYIQNLGITIGIYFL